MRAGGMCGAVVLMLFLPWLSACQGGSNEPVLKVSSTQLHFANEAGGYVQEQTLTATVENVDQEVFVDVAFSNNGLKDVVAQITKGRFVLTVTPKNPNDAGLGTFQDQIVIVVCEDKKCERHISGSPLRVDVSYTVQSLLTVSPRSLAFTHTLGSSWFPSHKPLLTRGVLPFGVSMRADQDWIQFSNFGGAPEVLINPTHLAVGRYQGTLNVIPGGAERESVVIPVTLDVVAPTLSPSPGELSFGGGDGTELSARTLTFGLDTFDKDYVWTVAVDTGSEPPWLQLSQTSGTVSGQKPQTLTARVDPTGLSAGLHTARLNFTAMVEGVAVTRTVPVSLSLVAHRLWVADNGVGLVQTPAVSRLTQTVKVKDSAGQGPVPWSAKANQPWLSITPGGGDTLTVTADPAGLAPDTLHLATVTLSASDGSVPGETVRVGLWVGASAGNGRDTLDTASSLLETDPIRPYAYVHDGTNLSVYNVHTAQRVALLPALGSGLGAMSVSTDGSTLYLLDQSRQVIPVDLDTLKAGMPWEPGGEPALGLTYARPNGHGLVITSTGRFLDAATGEVLFEERYFEDTHSFVSASLDGSMLCGGRYGDASPVLLCQGLRSVDRSYGRLQLLSPLAISLGSRDVALTRDGRRMYGATALPNVFFVLEDLGASSFYLPSSGYPVAVEVGPDDRFYGASATDVWAYDPAGTRLGSYPVARAGKVIMDGQLKVSGDGTRLVVLTNGPTLDFLSAP